MTKRKSEKSSRSYGQGKERKNIRLHPETSGKLARASALLGISQTAYIELALRRQFTIDKIK